MHQNNYVVIMAGGVGSRFWPMSRAAYPKQFLDILNTGKTLLQSTYERFTTFIPNENVYVITSDRYTDIVREQLPMIPAQNTVGEPERKNTGPCIAFMALKLKTLNPQANLIVVPSDHVIGDQVSFGINCLQALNFTAKNDAFVTLGIQPTYAHTGYGYIQYDPSIPGEVVKPVKRFTEKPNQETAMSFFQDPSYVWNSGIFIWKATDILTAFRKYMPDMLDAFLLYSRDLNTKAEKTAIRQMYKSVESISIDYAILEKADNVYVIPALFSWSDLGAYQSAWEHSDKDDFHNAISGENVMMVDATRCFVHSTENKLVLLGGVEDLIVVETADTLMICKKENEQQIKNYLERVKLLKGEQYH
jgi:mannose-1-phosphate guanylyltransferase